MSATREENVARIQASLDAGEAPTIDFHGHDLTGRTARCFCGRTVPSSPMLAFFEYRGPGMERPICSVGRCHFYESVHQPINPATGREGVTDHQFVARVYEHDSYYCGCRGWD